MSTDCGCGSAADARAVAQRAYRQQTQQGPAKGVPANQQGSAPAQQLDQPGANDTPVVAGPISRLNPQDGLFLRAQHLDGIQNYATALSRALGIAGGTGVVYGYELKLDDTGTRLSCTPGLAIAPDGQPLQSSFDLSYALDSLPQLASNDYWVIEIDPAEDTTGSENAYGTVCADPCDQRNSIRPWLRSLVRLRLRVASRTGLGTVTENAKRSWLASAYFEDERRDREPWPTPGPRLGGNTVGSLFSRNWQEAGVHPTGSAVPLGVLIPIGTTKVLDTWTARRELIESPGERRWDGHLGRRPWSVFLAQLLQFEDQLAGYADDVCTDAEVREPVADPLKAAIEEFQAEIEGNPISSWRIVRDFTAKIAAVEAGVDVQDHGKRLVDLGLVELPPAGYIGCVPRDQAEAKMERLFGSTVVWRLCDVRADDVPGAVQAAQHLDRIPLTTTAGPKPAVDILVPSEPADLAGLATDAYGWVAFVRRVERRCRETEDPEPKTELVDFALFFGRSLEVFKGLDQGKLPDEGSTKALFSVAYPVGDPVLPKGTKPPTPTAHVVTAVIGVSATDQPLAESRAEGVVKEWDLGTAEHHGRVLAALPRSLMLLCVELQEGPG